MTDASDATDAAATQRPAQKSAQPKAADLPPASPGPPQKRQPVISTLCAIAQWQKVYLELRSHHVDLREIMMHKIIDDGLEGSPFINPIERSLLSDLQGLYTCDLTREIHQIGHHLCLACAKEDILRAIARYIALDAATRRNGDGGS